MQEIKLYTKINKHNNNLALMQFLASIFVIFAHSYPISTNQKDILYLFSGGAFTFGDVSVAFFFLTGGVYIAKSMESKKTAKEYFKARAVRIFPSLITVVITSIVIGGFITKHSLMDYWTSSKTWRYLGNCIFVLQHELPGVFLNNPYNATVNGSLWTLPVEFLCYIACFLFYKLGLLSEKFLVSTPAVIIGIIVYKSFFDIFSLNAMIQPCLLFYIGMGIYIYRDKLTLSAVGNIISIVIFVILTVFGLEELAMATAFPYIILYMVFAMPQCPDKLASLGKLSYGIYLCGFPIQQYVAMYSKSPYVNFLISAPVSILGGVLIYKFIEKPVIKLERMCR